MAAIIILSACSIIIEVSAENIALDPIYPTEDGYIQTNKNTDVTTWINDGHLRAHGSSVAFRIAYLKFEVPEFTGVIENATLKLTSNSTPTLPESDIVTVHMVMDNDWDSVTNHPTYEDGEYSPEIDDTVLATYTFPNTDITYGQVVEIDLKDIIEEPGTYSIALRRSTTTGDLRFFSVEGATSDARKPQLNIEIIPEISVSTAVFTNDNDDDIDHLESGFITADIEITNNTDETTEAVLAMVLKRGSVIKDIKFTKKEIDTGVTEPFTTEIYVPDNPEDYLYYSVEVFTWESLEKMKPLASKQALSPFFTAPERTYEMIYNPTTMIQGFRDLASAYPDYISETFCSYDSQDEYPIYQYRLKLNQTQEDETTEEVPKLIIVSGIHGCERQSVWSTYYLFKALAEAWQGDPVLEYIRTNFEIVSIPLAAPNEFITGTYDTPSGVNVNRDFIEFTLPESRNVKKLLDENTDAIYYCDYHTNGSSGSSYSQTMTPVVRDGFFFSEQIRKAAEENIKMFTKELVKRYDHPEGEKLGHVLGSISGKVGQSTAYSGQLGIPSSVLETFRKFPFDERQTSTSQKANYEYFVNWLIAMIRMFNS
jgi:hypothetical protein